MSVPVKITAVIPTNNANVIIESIEKWDFSDSVSEIDLIFVLDSINKKDVMSVRTILGNLGLGNSQIVEGNFGSPGKARNAGMNLVKTKWITFWDSDDLPIPKKYIELIEKCESESMNFGIGGFTKIAFNGVRSPLLMKSSDKSSIIRDLLLYPGIWRWVFKYENVKNVPFQEFLMGEDQIFLLETMAIFSDKSVLMQSIYNYRTGLDHQLTANEKKVQDLEKTITYLRKSLCKYKDKEQKTILYMFIIKMYITFLKASPGHLVPLRILRFVSKSYHDKDFYRATFLVLSLRRRGSIK